MLASLYRRQARSFATLRMTGKAGACYTMDMSPKGISIYALLLAVAAAVLIVALDGSDDAEIAGDRQTSRPGSDRDAGHQANIQLKPGSDTAAGSSSKDEETAKVIIYETKVVNKLFGAIEEKDIDTVRSMIKADPTLVNAEYSWGDSGDPFYPSLSHAVLADDIAIARLLLEKGANPNGTCSRRLTALHLAVEANSLEMAQLLLDHGTGLNLNAPVLDAIRNGHNEMALFLLERGADPNGLLTIHWGGYKIAPRDVDEEVDPTTAIELAAELASPAVVKALLEAGSDTEERNKDGWTPLHIASSHGNVENAGVLLDFGADINAIDRTGWTALHWSANRSYFTAVAKLLIERGAYVDAQDRFGQTPLHHAIFDKSVTNAKLLIAHGANLYIQDKNGITPFDLAKQRGILKQLGFGPTGD